MKILYFLFLVLGEAYWLKPSTLARHHGYHLHELFYNRRSDKEHRTNKLPPTARVRKKSKGDETCPTTSQNPSCWCPSWLSNACATRKDPESEWFAKDNAETNPMTLKPETASHVAEQSSWVPLPYCSLPRRPFPVKSLTLSAHVSPWMIPFQVLLEATLRSWKGPSVLQHFCLYLSFTHCKILYAV